MCHRYRFLAIRLWFPDHTKRRNWFCYYFHYDSNKIRFFIFGKSYGKKNVLLCKQTGIFIRYFPLIRGNGVLFLSLKEKVPKRSKPACRWTACAYGNCIPQSPLALRERLRKAQNSSLDARVLRRSRFFGELLIVWKLFFWCVYRIKIPPSAYFSPTKLVRQICHRFFYGSLLQKPIGG